MGRLTTQQVREIRALREDGLSYNQIAGRFDLAGETVRQVCERFIYKRVDRTWPMLTTKVPQSFLKKPS